MKSLLFSFSWLFLLPAFAQQDTVLIDSVNFVFKKEIPYDAGFFTTDQLGYIYLSKGDQLTKLNADGEVVFQQSYKNMGDITSVDASQSLRTLLFYRDLTQIIFLDNSLSVQGESIKLEKENLTFVTLACASFMNNHFWIYQTDEFVIKRLDKQLNQIAVSGNIVQTTGKEINPDYLIESGNYVYLHDSIQGLLQFDLFGAYIQTIPVKQVDYFEVEDDKISFLHDNKLITLSTGDNSVGVLELPVPDVKHFSKRKNQLILQSENRLILYQLDKK